MIKMILSFICFIFAFWSIFSPLSFAAEFPKNPVYDFNPLYYQAKVLFPFKNSKNSRIWVKGSEKFKYVKIVDNRNDPTILNSSSLKEPFFTNTFEIKPEIDEVEVLFSNDNSNFSKSITIYPKNPEYFLSHEDQFSILFYGCFQPFQVKDENNVPKASLITGKFGKMNYLMRKMFHSVAVGDSFDFDEKYRAKKSTPKKTFFGSMPAEVWFGTSQVKSERLISNPRLIVGTGDQVYVDAGFEYKGNSDMHPISAWDDSTEEKYKKNPVLIRPLREVADLQKKKDLINRFINDMYLNFYSFDTLNDLFAKIPSVNAWDDHEIRDGWGSHGDEYSSQADGSLKLNADFLQFYNSAKQGYIEHQYVTGGIKKGIDTNQLIKDNVSLHQSFEVSGIKGFMFDLRSRRFIKKPDARVLGVKQFEDFKKWSEQLEKNETILIVSSMPLFFGHSTYAEKITNAATKGGSKDDFNDDWSSDSNIKEQKELIKILIGLREEKNIKPIIVSGDKHMGAMIEVWYTKKRANKIIFWKKFHHRKDRKVLAYELVSSGLSHEISQLKYKLVSEGIRLTEAGQIGQGTVKNLIVDNENFKVDPTVRSSRVRLNFGALEFKKDDLTTMHMFAANDDNSGVEERIMNLDWEKTDQDEIKWETTTWKQKIKNLVYLWILNKTDYTAAPVDAMRTISVGNMDLR